MTDKKEKILNAALELFAGEGFAATATSKIAKRAGVSEGLIFRHFENKQGLLDALMGEAERKMAELFGPVFFETDPKKVLRKTLEMPFNEISNQDFDFWRLQFMLKWQREYNNPDKMKPLIDKLTLAFKELEYDDPVNEANLFSLIVNGISSEILKGNMKSSATFKEFLLRKYDI